MATHHLKTINPHFTQLLEGKKTAELRETRDRTFEVGDILILREWTGKTYTGRKVRRVVSCVTEWENLQGVMLSFEPLPNANDCDSLTDEEVEAAYEAVKNDTRFAFGGFRHSIDTGYKRWIVSMYRNCMPKE